MRLTSSFLISAVLLAGCAPTAEPVPQDVEGLSAYIYQHWDDEARLTEGVENLVAWLNKEGVVDTIPDGYVLPDLVADNLASITYPADPPLETMIGVSAGAVSPYSISDHAQLMTDADQLWNNDSYRVYTREITDGSAAEFQSGQGVIATVNTIDKDGALGVHIPYILYKDYRWITLADGSKTVVGRSWTTELNCAEGGTNCIDLSFSIDFFYEADDGQTVRMTSSWNKLTTVIDGLVSEEFLIGEMVSGLAEIYEATDLKLEE